MPLLTPLYMGDDQNAVTYSAQQDRTGLLSSIFSREGVTDVSGGQLKVSQRSAGANFSVDVAPGRTAIYGDDISDQGAYVCTSTTVVNLTIPAKPASGTLTHRIIARVRDKLAVGTYTTLDWTLEVLADTGTGLRATPNSAISLATVAVSSSATSVTDAVITDTRPRASVGTPWLVGNMLPGGIHSGLGGRDATRPLTYQKSPDGFVNLSGWFRRSDANFTALNNQTHWLDGAGGTIPFLPPEIRPPGIRDIIGLSSNGYLHWAVYPNGTMSFRFNYDTTVTQNVTWFTLDGVSFRVNPF